MKQTNKVLGMILFMILIVGMFGTVSAVNVYQTIAPYQATSGHLYVTVLCHHNLFSKDMVLVNDIAPNVNTTISLGPDGRFDGFFIAGNYTLTLLDGNAGHTEVRKFTIRNGYEQYVTFIGHAVSMEPMKKNITPEPTPTPTVEPTTIPTTEPTVVPTTIPTTEPTVVPTTTVPTPTPTQCVPVVTINSAKYGASGACYEVVDVAAHNETVIDVFNHTEHQILTYQKISDEIPAYTEYLGNATRDGNSDNYKLVAQGSNKADYSLTYIGSTHFGDDYCHPNGESNNYDCGFYGKYQLSKPGHIHHGKVDAVYGFIVTTPFTDGSCPMTIACAPKPGDTKCEERFVPDTFKEVFVPATYKTVCDKDMYIDVTSNVQSVVNGGVFSFNFNNAPNPGGIFSTSGSLLSEISDPAYGLVKTATITYSVSCGGVQSEQVSGSEGQTITLSVDPVYHIAPNN